MILSIIRLGFLTLPADGRAFAADLEYSCCSITKLFPKHYVMRLSVAIIIALTAPQILISAEETDLQRVQSTVRAIIKSPRFFELARRVGIDAESKELKNSFPFKNPEELLASQIDRLLDSGNVQSGENDGIKACRVIITDANIVHQAHYWKWTEDKNMMVRMTWRRKLAPSGPYSDGPPKTFGAWEEAKTFTSNENDCQVLRSMCNNPMPVTDVSPLFAPHLSRFQMNAIVELIERRGGKLIYLWAIRSTAYTQWHEDEGSDFWRCLGAKD